jgi:hypothetical protein
VVGDRQHIELRLRVRAPLHDRREPAIRLGGVHVERTTQPDTGLIVKRRNRTIREIHENSSNNAGSPADYA